MRQTHEAKSADQPGAPKQWSAPEVSVLAVSAITKNTATNNNNTDGIFPVHTANTVTINVPGIS